MSEKKNENVNVNDEIKVNKVTGEVQKMKASEDVVAKRSAIAEDDFDPYAQVNANESGEGVSLVESGVFSAPHNVRRRKGGVSKDGFQFYDYYVGFKIVIDPTDSSQDIFQTLSLIPEATFTDCHKLLDVIYKGVDMKQLEIEKTIRTTTVNGRTYSEPVYTCRVSGKDGMGYPIHVAFKPSKGNKVIFDVLLERYKTDGIIK